MRYVRDPQALADADLVILPGSKNTLGDLCWLREARAWRMQSSRPGSARCRCWGSAAAIRCWAKPLSMRWSLALAPSPDWGC
ncbi:hypothetical protein LNP25_02400 [Klebsiella variicola subsp. variicola]|nr:hypothetical protein [Klebsiella variicola subsp. variicola]